MIIISLSSNIAGPACAVATSIKNNYYKDKFYPTNFFDYVVVSMKTINQVLSFKENNFNLLENNFSIEENNTEKNTIKFLNFERMICYHDLKKNYTMDDLNEVKDKYKRRYYRLKDYIKNEDIIYFIRYGLEEFKEILEFCKNIKDINPNLKFYFINTVYEESEPNINYDLENYFYVNFFNFNNNEVNYSEDVYYRTLKFNWNFIFNIINNNIINNNIINNNIINNNYSN